MDKLVEWVNKPAELYPLDKEAEYLSHIGGADLAAVTTRVNTRLGPPLLITRLNPARGRAATAPKYPRDFGRKGT